MKKRLFLLAMCLISVVYSYSLTPRQTYSILGMKHNKERNKNIDPEGTLEYIKTIYYQNSTLKLYRITNTLEGEKIIQGFYACMEGNGKPKYAVIPIFENIYSEDFKLYQSTLEDKVNDRESMFIIFFEVTNQLLKENKLEYRFRD